MSDYETDSAPPGPEAAINAWSAQPPTPVAGEYDEYAEDTPWLDEEPADEPAGYGEGIDPYMTVQEALESPAGQAWAEQQEQVAAIQGRAQQHLLTESAEANALDVIRQNLAEAGLQNPSTEQIERVAQDANEWLQADGRRLMAEGYSVDEVMQAQSAYTHEVVRAHAEGERAYANSALLNREFLREFRNAQNNPG